MHIQNCASKEAINFSFLCSISLNKWKNVRTDVVYFSTYNKNMLFPQGEKKWNKNMVNYNHQWAINSLYFSFSTFLQQAAHLCQAVTPNF